MVTTATLPIVACSATEASIRAAALKLSQVGGGIVQIPAGTIILTQPLVAYSGVTYEGTGYQADFRGGQTVGVGGTILQGDGTFDGVDYNATDGGVAPTDYNIFVGAMITGFGLRNLSFVNFLYGCKIGALYQAGCKYSRFEHISFIDCQQWGLWVENYIECTFEKINAINCQVGGVARVGSGATALNNGNSDWIGTFVQTASSLYAHGIVSWARQSSTINSNRSLGEQCNRSSIAGLSQTATMANASVNIGVTDSTKFPVGFPVTVSASVNGFITTEIYFVLTSAANVITLGRTTYGSAISATGSTAVNILSKGYANLEVAGLDANSFVTAETVLGVDLESVATMLCLVQNARYCTINGGYTDPIDGNNQYRTLVGRNSIENHFRFLRNAGLDFDINSNPNYFEGMRSDFQAIDFANNKVTGIGIAINNKSGTKAATGRGILYLTGFNFPDMYSNADTNGMDFVRAVTIDQIQVTNGATIALTNGGNCVNTYTSAGGSATLPAISANMPGTMFWFSNPQANAFTLNTAGETIDGAIGVVSLSVAANSAVMLVALDAGGTIGKYWGHYR